MESPQNVKVEAAVKVNKRSAAGVFFSFSWSQDPSESQLLKDQMGEWHAWRPLLANPSFLTVLLASSSISVDRSNSSCPTRSKRAHNGSSYANKEIGASQIGSSTTLRNFIEEAWNLSPKTFQRCTSRRKWLPSSRSSLEPPFQRQAHVTCS